MGSLGGSKLDGVEAGLRITAALDFMRCGGDAEELRAHFLWEVKTIMTEMNPEDYSTTGLAALLGVMIPEHASFLNGRVTPAAGRTEGKILRLLPHDDAAG